ARCQPCDLAAGAAGRLARRCAVADLDRGGRGLFRGCGGALVAGAAGDQCLWSDRGDGLGDHEGSVIGGLCPPAWWCDLGHAGFLFGWVVWGFCSWGCLGAFHWGGWGWAGICWSWRADG